MCTSETDGVLIVYVIKELSCLLCVNKLFTVCKLLRAVHILRNHFLSVSRPPPPFRNQIRHWIEKKLQ